VTAIEWFDVELKTLRQGELFENWGQVDLRFGWRLELDGVSDDLEPERVSWRDCGRKDASLNALGAPERRRGSEFESFSLA
jgi:hypothetical protein